MSEADYLPNLTPIRGITAILVAAFHFHFFLGPLVPYQSESILNKFYLMVDLFFVLSGFIMCYVYHRTFSQKLTFNSYTGFLGMRLARIYPLYIITLGAEVLIFLCFVVSGTFEELPRTRQYAYRLDALPANILFLHTNGFFDFATWNMPAWSLSAEWWAYMLFPVLFLAVHRTKMKNGLILMVLAIMGWLLIEYVLAGHEPFLNRPPNPNHTSLDVNWHFGTFRGIIGFVAGMATWQIYRHFPLQKIMGSSVTLLLTCIACIIVMHFQLSDTLIVLTFPIIILSLAYGSQTIDRIFRFSPLKKLGDWSFSIYMWHQVLINLTTAYLFLEHGERLMRPFREMNIMFLYALLVVYLIMVCLVGWMSYRFLERPTRRALQTWGKSRLTNYV